MLLRRATSTADIDFFLSQSFFSKFELFSSAFSLNRTIRRIMDFTKRNMSRVHKSLPLVPFLGQLNPFNVLMSVWDRRGQETVNLLIRYHVFLQAPSTSSLVEIRLVYRRRNVHLLSERDREREKLSQ